jgi:hypothetical protein
MGKVLRLGGSRKFCHTQSSAMVEALAAYTCSDTMPLLLGAHITLLYMHFGMGDPKVVTAWSA